MNRRSLSPPRRSRSRSFDPVRLLVELINCPSVNPSFLPVGDVHAGENGVSQILAELASHQGLHVSWQDALPKRSNILIRLKPAGRITRRILLAPHLDTVNAAHPSQFRACRKGRRIYGRGACDTKGSIAAMFTALCRIARQSPRPRHTEIVFAGLVDEESGQGGSRALAQSRLKADLAIVGEPTELKVVTAHKGNVWWTLRTRGRAAHGSRPELGDNAIEKMARIVRFLQSDYASFLRRRKHPLLGFGTVNVGVIQGGSQPNIVPDCCAIEIDRRTLPGETDAEARRELLRMLGARGLEAEVAETKAAPCLSLETPPGLPLVRQLMAGARQQAPVGVNYFCDAAVLANGGIPSVAFGPGDIAQAHTAQEWIDVRHLETAATILADFLASQP